LAVSVLAGCSSVGGNAGNATAEPVSARTLRASGFGRFEDGGNVPVNQRWLLAQQSAKLGAYRSLADQLYKVGLDGQKTVATQVIGDEAYRVYLDTYLREARTVDYHTVNDTLKVTMELTLTPRFYRCMSGDSEIVGQCLQSENKLGITRLGYRPAATATVNLACGVRDCGDRYYVRGFSKDRNAVDDVLLDGGLYDVEWDAHTGVSLFARLILLQGFFNGF